MIQALIYKEWLKTKWFILAILFLNLALITYIFIDVSHSVRVVGMQHIWNAIVNKNAFLFSKIKYLPIASAIILASSQYIPEVTKKRLKLTLHLPVNQTKAIFTMLGYGIITLISCFVFQSFLLLLFVTKHFPAEITLSTFITILPWYLAGVATYVLVAFICLEPTWRNRIIYALSTLAIIHFFLLSDFPSAYSKILYLIIIVTITLIVLPMYSVKRFKHGFQD